MPTSLLWQPQVKKVPRKSPSNKPKVIILAGPTAVGKTAMALLLADSLHKVEVVSADSMQVYRGMDIGTAKPSWEERLKVPHHLIDIREMEEPYNVVDFFYDALAKIADILKRGKIPLVSGGAGFYLRSLAVGPPAGPPSVPTLRQKIMDECTALGTEALFKRLRKMDPAYAATISSGDKQKIVRALEIIALTKQPVSALQLPLLPAYDWRCWFLFRERKNLYARIEKRCEQMVEEGLIDEVQRLKREGLLQNSSARQSIGYKQTLSFLNSPQTRSDFALFKEEFKKGSRHLAKRQMTWFRSEPDYRWLDLDIYTEEKAASLILKDFL